MRISINRRLTVYATFVCLLVAASCTHQNNNGHDSTDEPESELPRYLPGLGDYMLKMQMRHSKLWFAGINENWELADFQLHEIEEILEDIEKFKIEEDEAKLLPMIHAPLDSIDAAVDAKDLARFKSSYENLTATCNSCHVASEHAYNVVKIPDSPMFRNQEFSPLKE